MDLKESFFKKWFPLQRIFIWGNIFLFIFFIAAILLDQVRGWQDYQKVFRTKEIARAKAKLDAASSDDAKEVALRELHAAKGIKLEIRQLWVQKLDTVDRCITCHLGYDALSNPSLVTEYKEQPFSAPMGTAAYEIHKLHSFDKFGCVVCHGGQGIATEKEAAHGRVQHWESPMLTGTLIQASCKKCHDNLAELKINGEIYPSEVIRAKSLIRENGCIGCHQIGGEGGPVSVDFREETSAKPLSRIDFAYSGLAHEEWTLANWIKIHMTKDPISFSPGDPEGKFNTEPIAPSGMPPYLLPEKDANAVTAFILGLNRSKIPPEYLTLRAAETKPVISGSIEHGRYVYEEFGCAGCHGAEARGGIRNFNYLYDTTPNLRRAVATYSRQELAEKISAGAPLTARNNPHGPNPPLYMPAWKDKIKGKDLDDLVSYLMSIKE